MTANEPLNRMGMQSKRNGAKQKRSDQSTPKVTLIRTYTIGEDESKD